MGSSSRGWQDRQTPDAVRTVFERCLIDGRPVEVAFLSRRSGDLLTRQCVPVAPERAVVGEADARLYHFLHTNRELGCTHPLALVSERIVYIAPVVDDE